MKKRSPAKVEASHMRRDLVHWAGCTYACCVSQFASDDYTGPRVSVPKSLRKKLGRWIGK